MNFDLSSALETVRRRWYIMAVVLLLGAVTALVAAKHVRQFVANSAVVLTTQANGGANAPAQTGTTTPALLSIQPSDLPTLTQSELVLSRVAADIGYKGAPGNLRRSVRAHVGLQDSVMPIQFSDDDPDRAVAGANAVADELTNYYRSIATSRFSALMSDLQKQIETKRTDLSRLDAAVLQTLADNPYLASKDEPALLSTQLVNLQNQRDELAAMATADRAIANYDSRLTVATLPLAHQEIGDADPAYHALRAQYAKDAAELDRIRVAYSSTYPGLPELQEQVTREAQQVAVAAKGIASGSALTSQTYNLAMKQQLHSQGQAFADQARLAQLNAQISALQSESTQRIHSSVSAQSLRRDRDAADAALALLQARLSEAESDRAVAGSLGSIAVISRAVDAEPTMWTKPKVLMVSSLVAAFWIAIALIAALELFDRRLRSRKQIEELYGTPIVGAVGASV